MVIIFLDKIEEFEMNVVEFIPWWLPNGCYGVSEYQYFVLHTTES